MGYIALQKLYSVYALDTSCFYTDKEKYLDNKLQKARAILSKKKKLYIKNTYRQKSHISKLNKIISDIKLSLKEEIDSNPDIIRKVRTESLNTKNIVAVFDSNLTRCLHMRESTLNTELIIIKVYYFGVARDIIKNGFFIGDSKYRFFSASAGQIRTKKFVAVREDLLNSCWNTLTCGLSINDINLKGGINRNKYLAYLALCNSATDEWSGFDIDRCIVVDDLETLVTGVVDFIDEKTYKIERKEMQVPIAHTDGCGMMLQCVNKKNVMLRAPWIKGLLTVFPFDKFIREANKKESKINHALVKDIYGKQYDILKDNIQIILTKSQFKMWKYFSNWDEYKENFKKYGCTAGKCNEEDNYIGDAKFNYQMMQTLVDLTDEELSEICATTNNDLKNISSDRNTMLKVFGATPQNENKNNFQECLSLYPELLQDPYTRDTLKDIKKKIEKEGRASRIDIDGKFLFVIPDMYAFCQYLFLGDHNPSGLLKNGDVYCKIYSQSEKLDCLRSPHLDMAHAIRNNAVNKNKEYSRWFITNGIYTSCHDLISKILQFDNDGDKLLVCKNETIIKAAERNGIDVVPLYYIMAKAPAQIITTDSMYEGMIDAYTGGNIGGKSNDITKIWNSESPNMEIIKILCMETNFTIDYAKTLYKPVRPFGIDTDIKSYTKSKVPHFFIYAKDKLDQQVEPRNKSCVNRLYDIIGIYKFDFKKKQLGTFDYKMLMSDKYISLKDEDNILISTYNALSSSINLKITDDDGNNNYSYVFREIVDSLLEINPDIYHIVDVLILQLFYIKKSKHKVAFWNCFGDIVLENLKRNIDIGTIMCEECGVRFIPSAKNQIRCNTCQSIYRKKIINSNAKKYYKDKIKTT